MHSDFFPEQANMGLLNRPNHSVETWQSRQEDTIPFTVSRLSLTRTQKFAYTSNFDHGMRVW